MQEEWGCITIVLLFVILMIFSALSAVPVFIGELYTDIVYSDGWDVFIIILSLICGYLVYRAASNDSSNDSSK